MSGHSKWATIKRQKGVNDAKRGALFTKLGNQIAIAARAGADPTHNSALALAIEKAKKASMPNANIERSIQRVSDKSAAQIEQVMYEGYGPGGVAVIVEAATDNKNRTLPEVRTAFNKSGGNMAEPGSVAAAGIEVVEAESAYVPNDTMEISDKETARKVINMMDALEDLEDVTNTYTNFEIADGIEV
jgi:YebC/PmpR family DNA-binding regulatory protein